MALVEGHQHSSLYIRNYSGALFYGILTASGRSQTVLCEVLVWHVKPTPHTKRGDLSSYSLYHKA